MPQPREALERSEIDLPMHEQARSGGGRLAELLLVAATQRNAVSDALDAVTEQQEQEHDLAQLLSVASDVDYGADWPARRHAALERGKARLDRVSAREELEALAAQYRRLATGEQ